jgi:D-threo-aldose 1-dehydrogenase
MNEDHTDALPSDWIRELGNTGLPVSMVCIGGAPLGSVPDKFGYSVSTPAAVEFVTASFGSDLRFLDTSNGYSDGESERRIGIAIAENGGVPRDYLIATKTDAKDGDYSGARVGASVRESQERLGMQHLPLVYLHDPEFHDFDTLTAPGGAVDTLVSLRDSGVIGHLGVAGGDTRTLTRYLDLGVFEVLLTHSRATLIDRSADDLIDRASAEGLGIVNAAIYGGGILARPRNGFTTYGYRPASQKTLNAVASMADACERWGSDLATAAMQASVGDARIHSTVVGISKIERLTSVRSVLAKPLPQELWAELDALRPDPDNWLDAS